MHLRNGTGDRTEFRLVFERLEGWSVGIQIVEGEGGTPVGLPGTSGMATIAGAIAKSRELRVATATGHYSLHRTLDWVLVGHSDGDSEETWRAATAEVLTALQGLGSRAA